MLVRLLPLVVVGLAAATTARAEPANADEAIVWTAPAGCPDADVLRARVATSLGRAPRAGEVDAGLKVRKVGARWHVDMVVHTASGDGERSLEAASCDELASAAALIVVLAIDPMAGMGPPEPADDDASARASEPTEVAGEGATAAPRRVGAVDDERPPAPGVDRTLRAPTGALVDAPRELTVRVRAGFGGDLGSLPAPTFAAGAAIELGLAGWSVDLAVSRFAERDAREPDPIPKGAHVALTTIAARACFTGGARVRGFGCAGGELGVQEIEGFGFDMNEAPQNRLGGGPQLGIGWAARLTGPLWARVDVTATWQVVRQTLVESSVLDEPTIVIYDADPLSWRAFTGVEASWP